MIEAMTDKKMLHFTNNCVMMGKDDHINRSVKCGDEMMNSVDPDQTSPSGAVRYGSPLFAHAYCSEYLG